MDERAEYLRSLMAARRVASVSKDRLLDRVLDGTMPVVATMTVFGIIGVWLLFQAIFWGGILFLVWGLGRWVWSWA